MIGKTGAAILFSAALLATMPAHALQREFSTKETRALTHAYAKCVVDRQAKKASEALLENADGSIELITSFTAESRPEGAAAEDEELRGEGMPMVRL